MKTEGQKGIKERINAFLWLSFPNSTKQTQGKCMLLVFGVTDRQSDCYVECFTVQHIVVYSVQLNCTDSNYRERVTVMFSVLLYRILSVLIV